MRLGFFRIVSAALATVIPDSIANAAEYRLRLQVAPRDQHELGVVISTPAGWEGWKDNPHYWDGVDKLSRRLLESEHKTATTFVQPSCQSGSDCPRLDVRIYVSPRSTARPVTPAELPEFMWHLRQHEGRSHSTPRIRAIGSFDAAGARRTLWEIRCDWYNDYYMTLVTQDRLVVAIYLEGQDVAELKPKLNTLKEVARSIRFER